jgi:transglutaminase-like putative cysteine protease
MAMLARRGAKSNEIISIANRFSVASFDRWVRSVYVYRDEDIEMIRTPEFMIGDWKSRGYIEGDCDDIATFGASVFLAIGVPCRIVAIRTTTDNPNYRHVFVEILLENVWIRFDPTVSNETVFPVIGSPMILRV